MTDDDLRAEIVALRNRLAELESRLEDEPHPPRRLTRRGLLAGAVAAGAGLIATQVTTAAPAAAAPGGNLVLGGQNDAGSAITSLTARTGINSTPLAVINPDPNGNSIGFAAQLGSLTGRFTGVGYQRAAVVGESSNRTGVTGMSNSAAGVYGYSYSAYGVVGDSDLGIAVFGASDGTHGIFGQTGSDSASGVVGVALRSGIGVLGVAKESGPAVVARNEGTGPGVTATGGGTAPGVVATSTSGPGVQAAGAGTSPGVDTSSASGYGLLAKGGRAPVRLVPSTKVGAPTTGNHQAGELYVDKNGALFYCTTGGAPGTWKTVALS